MTSRKVLYTLRVEQEFQGEVEIDEEEYIEWLNGAEDSEHNLAEFFRSDREYHDIKDQMLSNSYGPSDPINIELIDAENL